MPQQDFAPGAGASRATASLPSTAAQTGDSMKIPGASDARTRRARPKARIERIRQTSYTMENVMAPEHPTHSIEQKRRLLGVGIFAVALML
ncbi:MAG TPA: hypothetical protein VK527_04570, partial [Candidatus Limnocylindrales bacterium]|nr:hypothetical protein [Candidatus Limnocylindrales bacterium]